MFNWVIKLFIFICGENFVIFLVLVWNRGVKCFHAALVVWFSHLCLGLLFSKALIFFISWLCGIRSDVSYPKLCLNLIICRSNKEDLKLAIVVHHNWHTLLISVWWKKTYTSIFRHIFHCQFCGNLLKTLSMSSLVEIMLWFLWSKARGNPRWWEEVLRN